MKTTRNALTIGVSVLALSSVVGGAAWASNGAGEAPERARAATSGQPTTDLRDGMQPGVEGTGEWIHEEPGSLAGTYGVFTGDGRRVAPTVEGAVGVFATADASGVPTAWQLVALDGDRYQLRTVMTTDGEPHCLTVSDEATGLNRCDEEDPAQSLHVEHDGRPTPTEVDLLFPDGYLAAERDGGLALASQAGERFVLAPLGD